MHWILGVLVVLLSSCQGAPQERHYTEETMEAPSVNTSNRVLGLSWDVPEGWRQEGADKMRLATFREASDPEAIDCSIVSLEGAAGGLEANIKRWMGQIELTASTKDLAFFIDSAPSISIQSGQKARVYDLARLKFTDDLIGKTMLVVMIELSQSTVFVKMIGSFEAVKKNKNNFFKLIESIDYS